MCIKTIPIYCTCFPLVQGKEELDSAVHIARAATLNIPRQIFVFLVSPPPNTCLACPEKKKEKNSPFFRPWRERLSLSLPPCFPHPCFPQAKKKAEKRRFEFALFNGEGTDGWICLLYRAGENVACEGGGWGENDSFPIFLSLFCGGGGLDALDA